MTSRKRTSSESRGDDAAAPFVYCPAPGWSGPTEGAAGGAIAVLNRAAAGAKSAPGSPGSRSAEETSLAREKQSFEKGLREGVAKGRAEREAEVQLQRESVTEALREFAQTRADYFRRVEAEVVSLALAIARRILRREAQMDPLLLTGMVRVALEKMAASHNVRMRVHPSQIEAWQNFLAREQGLIVTPELSGDVALQPNQCQLETELGVTELSLEGQLKEIEQGLFDLLAQRPGPE
jgi:flagellar assembly protein FliH